KARSNRSSWRRNAITSAIQHAVVAKDRTPGRRTSCAPGVIRRIKDWPEYVEPACDRRVATDRRDQEVAGASCRHIGNSHALGTVAAQFLCGSLKKLRGRTATQWFKPPPAGWVDMAAGNVTCHPAGWVSEHDDRKLQPLSLVDSHNSDAFGTFLHDRRLVRFT